MSLQEFFEKIKRFFQRLGFLKPATQDQSTQTTEEEIVAPPTTEDVPPTAEEEFVAPQEPPSEDPMVNYEFVDEQSLQGHPIYQNSIASEPQ